MKGIKGSGFFVETTFVLFFLSLDLGQNISSFGPDSALVLLTILMVAVLPFFLPSAGNAGMGSWLVGRTSIVAMGLLGGVFLDFSAGGLVPEVFRTLPLVFATFAAIAACWFMFSGFFRYRLTA
ncbi:MAG: hypothetical protein R2684_07080 [Pyrinomonadaceae bacterium]